MSDSRVFKPDTPPPPRATLRQIGYLMRALWSSGSDPDQAKDRLRIERLINAMLRFGPKDHIRLARFTGIDVEEYPVSCVFVDQNVASFRSWLEDVKGLPRKAA